MHVLIATPTANQLVTSAYTATLVNATKALHAAGLDYHHSTFDGADIIMARNYLANMALLNPAVGWVLWIDSDMAIPMRVFERLLAFNRPMVGGVYSERSLDLEKYVGFRNEGYPDDQARGMSTNFNVRVTSGTMTVQNGFCAVDGLGFGCVLTRRDLLERLVQSGIAREVPSGKLVKMGLQETMRDFFGEIRRDDGSYLSEDYSFCQRVRDLGETVWGLADERLGHVGNFEYGASFLAHLQGRQAQKDRQG
ncbi:MAG: hypothetical protein R3F61_29375 [Myxococcota bacterium]